jgi:hypothetical protein
MSELDLTKFENLDAVDRERWSIAASEALIRSQTPEVLAAIAAGGLDKFMAIAKPIYAGHAFKFEDFKRMYQRICRASSRQAADPRRHGRVH